MGSEQFQSSFELVHCITVSVWSESCLRADTERFRNRFQNFQNFQSSSLEQFQCIFWCSLEMGSRRTLLHLGAESEPISIVLVQFQSDSTETETQFQCDLRVGSKRVQSSFTAVQDALLLNRYIHFQGGFGAVSVQLQCSFSAVTLLPHFNSASRNRNPTKATPSRTLSITLHETFHQINFFLE